VEKALVPLAMTTPYIYVEVPVPPEETPRGLVRDKLVNEGVEVTAMVMELVVVVIIEFVPWISDIVEVEIPPRLLMMPLLLKVFQSFEER